jgi:putative flippase GtrA
VWLTAQFNSMNPVSDLVRRVGVGGSPGESFASKHQELRGPFFRFLLTGATNTLITGSLIVFLAQWVGVEIAYTIVWVFGLTFTTIVTGPFVFRTRLTSSAIRRFLPWSFCVCLVGVLVARLAGHQLHISHLLTTGAVLVITVPLNFLGGTRAFATRATPRS